MLDDIELTVLLLTIMMQYFFLRSTEFVLLMDELMDGCRQFMSFSTVFSFLSFNRKVIMKGCVQIFASSWIRIGLSRSALIQLTTSSFTIATFRCWCRFRNVPLS